MASIRDTLTKLLASDKPEPGTPLANYVGQYPFQQGEAPLEAPMFSPDDLIGTGIGKAALVGGAKLAPLLMSMVKPQNEMKPLVKALEAESNTIENVVKPYKDMGLDIFISASKNKPELNLSQIVVPKEMRNQGIGTKAMQDITNYADQTGNRITLTPSTSFGATSVDRLKDFYKQLGFVENKGKFKDFSTRETMYRDPQQ